MRRRSAFGRGLVTAVGLPLFAVSLVALQAGCGGGKCQGVYHCPTDAPAEVSLPADGGLTLDSVTTQAPCRVTRDGDAGRSWLVSVNGAIADGVTKVCKLQGRRSDGVEVEATASFQAAPCCSFNVAIGGPMMFTVVDGGAADAPSQ